MASLFAFFLHLESVFIYFSQTLQLSLLSDATGGGAAGAAGVSEEGGLRLRVIMAEAAYCATPDHVSVCDESG